MGAMDQAFNQTLGLEGLNYRDYMQQIQNMQYGDQYNMANAALQQQQHQFDTQTGLASSQQWYNQMLGLEGLNYRDYLSYIDQNRYQDSLALALAGLGPTPSYATVNPGLSQAPMTEYGYDMLDWSRLGN